MARFAMSWTGGKDSSLALYEASKSVGVIDCLITFAPGQEKLLAHSIDFMALQAKALGVPHYVFEIEEPFDLGYENAISSLKKRCGINALVTGDIGVAGQDHSWMENRCALCGVDLIRPLWHRNRVELLNKLLSLKFKVVFSFVKGPWFTDEWLGSNLSLSSVQHRIELSGRTGVDICGEQGEYHTMVLDGPQFRKRISIGSYSVHIADSIMYITFEKLRLVDKST
jgi:diphthine-ammonia ligase